MGGGGLYVEAPGKETPRLRLGRLPGECGQLKVLEPGLEALDTRLSLLQALRRCGLGTPCSSPPSSLGTPAGLAPKSCDSSASTSSQPTSSRSVPRARQGGRRPLPRGTAGFHATLWPLGSDQHQVGPAYCSNQASHCPLWVSVSANGGRHNDK